MIHTPSRPITTRRIRQEDLCHDPQRLCDLQVFLERYAMAERMLRLCRADERSRKNAAGELTFYGRVGGEAGYWSRQMIEVRTFIDSLPNESCKLLLYYHYVLGMTVERASEELDISRRNAYRLKKKALAFAAHRLEGWLREQSRQSGSSVEISASDAEF